MFVSILYTSVLEVTVRKGLEIGTHKTELVHWAFQLNSQVDLDEDERAKTKLTKNRIFKGMWRWDNDSKILRFRNDFKPSCFSYHLRPWGLQSGVFQKVYLSYYRA